MKNPGMTIRAIEEAVDHHVTVFDAELRQKSLQALTSMADDDTSHDDFQLARSQTNDQNTGRAIEPPAMEYSTPFQTKMMMWID